MFRLNAPALAAARGFRALDPINLKQTASYPVVTSVNTQVFLFGALLQFRVCRMYVEYMFDKLVIPDESRLVYQMDLPPDR